jgi:hypothetical protein
MAVRMAAAAIGWRRGPRAARLARAAVAPPGARAAIPRMVLEEPGPRAAQAQMEELRREKAVLPEMAVPRGKAAQADEADQAA